MFVIARFRNVGRFKPDNKSSEIQLLFTFQEALRTQTVDDYFEKNPSMKKEIDEELAHQNWGY